MKYLQHSHAEIFKSKLLLRSRVKDVGIGIALFGFGCCGIRNWGITPDHSFYSSWAPREQKNAVTGGEDAPVRMTSCPQWVILLSTHFATRSVYTSASSCLTTNLPGGPRSHPLGNEGNKHQVSGLNLGITRALPRELWEKECLTSLGKNIHSSFIWQKPCIWNI